MPCADAIATRNARLFVAFRVLYSARFYYPIFAILFLDFGLSLEQFALLNVIWAVTIILAEVPSGALSDLFGRKQLLVFTSALMVVEIALWAFAPTENITLLFWLMALNRILSGLGEAAASGSDEALTYDSLEQAGRKEEWSAVLASASRWQSFGFIFSMIAGGVFYDAGSVQAIANFLGIEHTFTQEVTMRFPLYLTLLSALVLTGVSLCFTEPARESDSSGKPHLGATFRQTFEAGKWIARTPFALMVILAGAFIDSVVRMFVTLGSEYYRLIEFPPASFGFIGAGIAALGILTASMNKWLVDKHSPRTCFWAISLVALAGFSGSALFIPYAGLVFAVLLFVCFSSTTFCLSYYLNHITEKSQRATVLSFKGMALNLGYALIGWLYAMLGYALSSQPELAEDPDALFRTSLQYFPPYFLAGIVLLIGIALWLKPTYKQEAS